MNSNLTRRKFVQLATAGSIVAATVPSAFAKPAVFKPNEKGPFDLVIKGGRVIDPETGLDAIRNVGLKDDRIAAISEKKLKGNRVLDAEGMIVSPGFIDLHSHGMQLPAAWMQAFDGVTTHLELESGLLPIGMAYDNMTKEGRPINFGAGAAWTYARIKVLQPDAGEPDGTLRWFQNAFSKSGWQNAIPTKKQLEQIIANVEQGLQEGGLGVSINAGYAPGMGRKEYYQLAELAAKYKVATYTHDRYMSVLEPNSSFEAIGEQIGLSAITGAHMHICHINSVAGRDLKAATDLVKEAQAKGINVTAESYTYGAFATAIGAEFMRGDNWLERFGGDDYGAVEYLGKPLNKAKIEEMQKSEPGAMIVFHFLDEENEPDDQKLLDYAVLFPGGAIASDCMPWFDSKGAVLEGDIWPIPQSAFSHPRSAGCYSRFFARWVRDRKALPLMEAIRKCTLIPAQVLEETAPQIKKKGRIQVGCDADIVVFDLNKIQDNATMVKPVQPSTGHKHVIVNGIPIIENGKRVENILPGKPVRRNV